MLLKAVFFTVLSSAILLSQSCLNNTSHKRGRSATATKTTEATESSKLPSAAINSSLKITSLNILGKSSSKASLKLAGDTDFDLDSDGARIQDESLEGLETASAMLCYFNEAAYTEMVNKGSYVALADFNKCWHSSALDSSDTSSQLMSVTLDVTRVDELSPIIVNAWFKDHFDNKKEVVSLKLIVSEGESEQNPLGIFSLNWEGKIGDSIYEKGAVVTKRSPTDGKLSLSSFYSYQLENGKFTDYATNAVLIWNAKTNTAESGAMLTTSPDPTSATSEAILYSAAFDGNHYLKEKNGAAQSCLDRKAYSSNVWRYGLYTSEGERFFRNSGIELYADVDGEKIYGNSSKYGTFFPESVAISDGLKVKSVDGVNSYTLRVGPSRLFKYERVPTPLSALTGIELVTDEAPHVVVVYDGTNFIKKAIRTAGSPDVPASGIFTIGLTGQPHYFTAFIAPSLGRGYTIYADNSRVPEATYDEYVETEVAGSQEKITLYCYSYCLRGNLTLAMLKGSPLNSDGTPASTIPIDLSSVNSSNAAAVALASQSIYEYDPSNLTLYLINGSERTPVVIKAGESFTGFETLGASLSLRTTPVTNLLQLYSPQDVSYHWGVSPTRLTQFNQLQDSAGKAVAFDEMLEFDYVHSLENDASKQAESAYYGQHFQLKYGEFGFIDGIPLVETEPGLWSYGFSLASGTKLGNYKVKALETELRMLSLPLDVCSSLTIDKDLILPSSSILQSPNIGVMPSIDGLSVIKGEVLAK